MTNTKLTTFILFYFFFIFNTIGQTNDLDRRSKNSSYIDMSSLVLFSQISINYERIIYDREKFAWYGRFGLGKTILLFDESKNGSSDDFLLGLTMLTGKANNHFELDLGTYIGNYNGSNVYPIIDIGYRYQKRKSGINFKAKVGTLGLGIGLGYNF